MKVKAVAFDLDGTLLNDRKEISEKNRKSIKSLQNAGVKILFATGRNDVYVRGLAASLGGVEAIIACNGALIKQVATGKDLYHRFIDKTMVHELAMYGFEHHLDFTASVYDAMFCVSNSKRVQVFLDYNKIMTEDYEIPICYMNDADTLDKQNVFKMFVWQMKEKEQQDFLAKYGYSQEISMIVSEKNGLDISPADVNKGTAIERFAQIYNIALEDIAAFGDHDNDICMLGKVGYSVVMENASDNVKQHARYCTKNHNEDGVAWAIENYLK